MLKKIMMTVLRLERTRGTHLPYQDREPVAGNNTVVCMTHAQCDARLTVTFSACAGTKLYCLVSLSLGSDGVKDMTHEAKAKAKAKDLTCHAALKPQTLYTVQC